jgi:hypothetical protein
MRFSLADDAITQVGRTLVEEVRDVQYFPAGDEFLLPNQVRALEQYKLEQEAIRESLDEEQASGVPTAG